jgi:hypothetical protein
MAIKVKQTLSTDPSAQNAQNGTPLSTCDRVDSNRSLREGTPGVDDDGTPAPQPPPTPPHASPIKNKGHTPTNSTSPPGTSGDPPQTPNSHPNAALDTLIPANIESILVKSPPPPDQTSTAAAGDPPKTPTFSPDGISMVTAGGSMSPFTALTMNALTPAGLDDIIQRLLTTAYSAKITKNFCLRTHEITSLCQGPPRLPPPGLLLMNTDGFSCPRNIYGSTYAGRVDSSCKNSRRRTRSIRRSYTIIRNVRLATKRKLPIPRRLRRQR